MDWYLYFPYVGTRDEVSFGEVRFWMLGGTMS